MPNDVPNHEKKPMRRVLVVDDDPVMRDVMEAALLDAGLASSQADNGEAALARLDRDGFSLALIDLGMPKLDGFGLLRHIRSHPTAFDLPVIVVTAHDDRASIERAYQLGASSFITKPVNWTQFAHHMQFVMRSAETARALRLAEAAALEASRLRGWLFRMLSNELKTPLAAMIGMTGVLAEALHKKIEPEEIEYLEHVTAAASHLNVVIADVLVLARALSGLSSQQLVPVPVAEIIDDSVVGLKAKARSRGIAVVVRLSDLSGHVACDAPLLRQALNKLVDNAVRFSPQGGTVEISAALDGVGGAVISVTDQGNGLSLERLEANLQPLASEEMGYIRPSEGPGLGLPIAKAIAGAHGGELLLRNRPGAGLEASIRLPGNHPRPHDH